MKAGRNKTIDMSVEEGACYLERCITITESTTIDKIIDKTILGDTFYVLKNLPSNFVDLLIVDPPYNLNKDFHGQKFRKATDDDYEEYTELWVRTVFPSLKDNASIYVCCDWNSSSSVRRVLKKYFHIQ